MVVGIFRFGADNACVAAFASSIASLELAEKFWEKFVGCLEVRIMVSIHE